MNKKYFCFIAIVCSLLSCSKPDVAPKGGGEELPTPSLTADLFDLTVSSKALGADLSRHHCSVVTNTGFPLSAYYKDIYKSFVAVFNATPGSTVGSGYYRVDYSSDKDLQEQLSKGFSTETVFSAGALPSGKTDAAVFSSVQDGGFGIGVTSGTSGNHICFELYTDKHYTLDSGITPIPGYYYHVVGLWNKDTAKACLYVDGVLKSEKTVGGSLTLPPASAGSWFCIGGDSSSSVNYAERMWQGEVAVARLWGRALDAGEIASLYEKVKNNAQVRSTIKLTDVSFLSNCNVGARYKYHVYAKGVASGDVLVLRNTPREIACETAYAAGQLTATLPAELVSGTWMLLLRRGEEEKNLGNVTFKVSSNPGLPSMTKVFAHRCVHNNTSGPYENSLEALKKTQTYGIYGAEFDVWITNDGYVVVHHDAAIGGYTIQESSWSQIKNIKLSSRGEHLPLLSEFLDQGLKVPGVILNFEIKKHSTIARDQACADAVAALLKERNMASQCRVMSYSTEALDRLRSKIPSLQLDYMGSEVPSVPAKKGYNGISYNMNLLSANPGWIELCHASSLKVCTWTPSTEADLMTFINLGADYVTVNNVDLAKTVTGRPYISLP